jgi:predicted dehydrogenase
MSEYTEFEADPAAHIPGIPDKMAVEGQFHPDLPWWERVTPYTGILYVDYVLSHQMTPLYLLFLFTILFRYGVVTGNAPRGLSSLVECFKGENSSVNRKRGSKMSKKKAEAEKKKVKKFRMGVVGNLSELRHTVMEPSKKIENLEVYAHAAVHRQHRLDFGVAYDKVLRSYESLHELVRSAEVSAVFLGLCPTKRFRYTRDALQLGKHVLCPSPVALSGEEASQLVALAKQKGVVLQEALHHRHHPIYARFESSVVQLGTASRAKIVINVPWWAKWWWPFSEPTDGTRPGGGGSAFMMYGPFALDVVRTLFQENDPDKFLVKKAEASTIKESRDVDFRMRVELEVKDDAKLKRAARIDVSYGTGWWPSATVEATTPKGKLFFYNFMLPHRRNYIDVQYNNGFSHSDKSSSVHSTYQQQLIDFSRACIFKDPPNPGNESPVFISSLIGRVFAAAGLAERKSFLGVQGWSYTDVAKKSK